MARLRFFSPLQQAEVAQQLGAFLSEGRMQFEGPIGRRLEVHENFPIVVLKDQFPPDTRDDLRDWIVDTGMQLHRLVLEGKDLGFSISHQNEGHSVIDQYSVTAEAEGISEAIELVNSSDIPDDYEASILDLRARHLGALILVSDEHRPTLAVPFRVPLNQNMLRTRRVYPSEEFLKALSEIPRASGWEPDLGARSR